MAEFEILKNINKDSIFYKRRDCNNLKTVTFESSIPPTVEGRKEYLFNSNTMIYIQNKALDAYLQVSELSNCKLLDCNIHK